MPDSLPTTDAEPQTRPARASADWRALFAAPAPSAILARLVDEDPLRVRARVASGLRDEAYLIDADRVELRALARIARAAVRYDGRPEIGAWLAAIVRESIEELVREDLETEGAAAGDETAGAMGQLAAPLGLDPAAMSRACAAFNRLPQPDRRAFFDLVIQARSLDELCREGGDTA